MVLGECGRLPLCTTYYINCIRYWCKLLTMPPQKHPKQCYNMLESLLDHFSTNMDSVSYGLVRMMAMTVPLLECLNV